MVSNPYHRLPLLQLENHSTMRRYLCSCLLGMSILLPLAARNADCANDPNANEGQTPNAMVEEEIPFFPITAFVNDSAVFSLTSDFDLLPDFATPKPLPFLPLPIELAPVENNGSTQDLPPLSITDNQGRSGDLGVQLWMTAGKEFYTQWKSHQAKNLLAVKRALRNTPVSTVLFFTGETPDAKGLYNVNYDIKVSRPDGTVYGSQNNVVALNGALPKGADNQDWQVAKNYIAINIDPEDPAGLYKVDVFVTDQVTHKSVPLKWSFLVE